MTTAKKTNAARPVRVNDDFPGHLITPASCWRQVSLDSPRGILYQATIIVAARRNESLVALKALRLVNLSPILIALCILLPLELTSALGGMLEPPVLDPKSYKSPSGRYTLLVDPSNSYGAGSANYSFYNGDDEIWSGDRSFTLWDARVSDSGMVGGYAYSHGLGAWKENGEFRVIIIEQGGSVRLDQANGRRNSISEVPPSPYARGILLDSPNDRMVIRIADSDPNRCTESWWEYSISKASRDRVYRPSELPQDARINGASPGTSAIIEAEPVLGTTMTLVNWTLYDREFEETESKFSLIDLAGHSQWTRDMPRGTRISSPLIGQRRFGLLTPTSGQRIDYAIEEADSREFSVRELSRTTSAAKRISHQLLDVEARPLRLVGQIELRSPNETTGEAQECAASPPGTNPGPARWSTYSSIGFDGTGRIYAIGSHDMAVRVFNPEGDLVRTLSPKPFDKDLYCHSSKICVSEKGEIYLYSGSGALGRLMRLVHYSPDGQYLGLETVPFDKSVCGWHSHPTANQHWIAGYSTILLVNPIGRIAKTISRCPDNRWLARPHCVSVAPDGSLAVIARGAVSFYNAEGEPVAMSPLPPSIDEIAAQTAYNGKHIIIIDHAAVFSIDICGTTCRLLRPSASTVRTATSVPFFARRGGELYVFDGLRTIKRYELPTEIAKKGG